MQSLHRSANPRAHAREAKRDQGQAIEIARFPDRKTGETRRAKADWQRLSHQWGSAANEANI